MIAEISGARLWFEDSGGAGAAVVLLHAGTGSSRMWRHQVPAFAGAGLRVIAYDRRGHGQTESAEAVAPAATDLAALLDALRIEAAHLVGTAAGAIVAADFALSHPGRTRSLVLANTHLAIQDDAYAALQKRLRPPPQFDALPAEVKELGPSYRAAHPEGVQKWLEIERAARRKGAATLPETANPITFEALGRLAMPVLFLTGDADLYMPPHVLRLLAGSVPGAGAVVIPEAGHSAYWEQPAAFNDAVLRFLSGPKGDSSPIRG
ncbi:MAG TPA: alpha/beta fold hydrolase [Burkholderiales bacterium]|nr:alpha/beta fold hydrolase [Burkholderiales bacterium]